MSQETLTLLAQAAPSASLGSLWDLIVRGGVLMAPIGLCSLLALAVIVERSVSLRRARIIPPGFLAKTQAAFGAGRNVPAALELCRVTAAPIALIFAAALKRLHEPEELLERHIEQAGEREVLKLRKFLRTLTVVASVAPLLGLLGTIFGMIKAFSTVASSGEALGRTELLAGGIYEALITTAAGLIVAIPAIVGYHALAAKIERLVTEMDELTVEFVEWTRVEPRRVSQAARGLEATPDAAPLVEAPPALATR